MSYLEQQQGVENSDFSADFLDIDAKSGPWLVQAQQAFTAVRAGLPRWDIDPEQELIFFGNDERIGVVARYDVIGTYDPSDGTWLWVWANPKIEHPSEAVAGLREAHPDVPELTEPSTRGAEVRAWTLAAAAAMLTEAEGCFKIPGDIATFVALRDVHELSPDDPRARREAPAADDAAAGDALATYAGPMALNLGGLVLDALRDEALSMDQVIEALHGFADNLAALAESPVGKGTPAAAEAVQLAGVLRQGALCLAVPRESDGFAEGVRELMGLLEHLARHYGAWPDQHQDAPDAPDANDKQDV